MEKRGGGGGKEGGRGGRGGREGREGGEREPTLYYTIPKILQLALL